MFKVSILVPIYKVESYIKRCIDSIFSQDYENIEYIFVDDCSPDNSVNIINETLNDYPHRINQVKVIRHESNKGLGASRLTAINNASGDYVMHVDSDDWIEPNVISDMVNVAINDGADLIISDYYMAYQDGTKQKVYVYNCYNRNKLLNTIISREGNTPVCLWNKLISRQLHMKVLPEMGINFAEDFFVFPRLIFYSKKISKLDKFTYNYWQGNQSSYVKNFNEASYNNLIYVVNSLDTFFKDKTDIVSKKSLNLMKLRAKLMIISKGDTKQRDQALRLWSDVSIYSGTNFYEKIVFLLASSRAYKLIDFILRNGVKTKHYLLKIKQSL